MMDLEDDYIEPAETCEWLLGLEPGCCIDDPKYMCSECPNLSREEKQRRERFVQEFLEQSKRWR